MVEKIDFTGAVGILIVKGKVVKGKVVTCKPLPVKSRLITCIVMPAIANEM